MVSAGTVSTEVTGVMTTPDGPKPLAGTATGTMAGAAASLQVAFLQAFNDMTGITEGGDAYMAGKMADAVDAYLKAAVVSTEGENALEGSAGTGSMA
jgi:hypothetical protein